MQTAHLSTLPAEDSEGQPQKLTAQRTLLYGAMSGAAAELACYPLEVIRRHMQLQHLHAISGNMSQLICFMSWGKVSSGGRNGQPI